MTTVNARFGHFSYACLAILVGVALFASGHIVGFRVARAEQSGAPITGNDQIRERITKIGLIEFLGELAETHRHYHGIVDVNPDMPASIDLHLDRDRLHRVRCAFRGDRFSVAHYTEMPLHDHGYAASNKFSTSVTVQKQPTFNLNMGYGDLTASDKNKNQGSHRLIVSLDHHPPAQVGDEYNKTKMINRKDDVVAQIDALSGFKETGNVGTKAREGKPYDWPRDMRVCVVSGGVRTDITQEILKRTAKNWPSLGNGSPDAFTTEGTGLLDLTDLVRRALNPNATTRLELTLGDSGGKIHYDIICD